MTTTRVTFDEHSYRTHLCMVDFLLISPDGRHEIELTYAGEPPHGDSFHFLKIDGIDFPGWAWGCHFAISLDSRYLALSWMAKRIERRTAVIDLNSRQYFVIPEYIYDVGIMWPDIVDMSNDKKLAYRFDGMESWLTWTEE